MGTPEGCKQYGCVMIRCKSALGGPFPSLLAYVNGLRKKLSCLVGPPFPAVMASFSATAGWHSPGYLIASS